MTQMSFPDDFKWGVATSSYQIEGAWNADGKGESIWDRFAHQPGNIIDGTDGDIACEHYTRYAQDVELMKSLNMQAYRFSISWPCILPTGKGEINQAGLDFYGRLVDTLLEAGIEPFATLYHWDLPQALQNDGGWPARSTAEAFVEYADVVTQYLGDRVKNWITHNEPWCISFLSHQIGEHAPGWQDWHAAIRAAHHVLLSHGWAVPVIRRNSPEAEVGIVLNFEHVDAASDSEADREAARRQDGYANRWFVDPIYGRHYPADMVKDFSNAGHLPNGLDFIYEGDYRAMAVKTDFLGVNYYTRSVVRDNGEGWQEAVEQTESAHTDRGWEIYPQGLAHLLNRLTYEYRVPKMYITENGCSYATGPAEDGSVPDANRLEYLRQHFVAAHSAMECAAPLAGYFVWSLMDNFEWGMGYSDRFGIVWVDYETQERTPKDSALWYKDVIAANAVEV